MRKILLLAATAAVTLAGCSDSPGPLAPPPDEPGPWTPPSALPAFPGAEGFGAYTTHARGGQVVRVTNLNDSGAGSLRAAVQGNNLGARFVVFDVSGIIQLNSAIVVRSGNLYIAGQTAPGDGITLKGAQLSIQASDVVVRHIRLRPGDQMPGEAYDNRDALQILGSPTRHLRNIIVDHVSASWGVDENMSVWPGGSDGRIENVTIQWSIIAEALHASLHSTGPHGMGLLIGEGTRNISVHHNLLAHNNQRNPRVKHDVVNADIVNNVVYNWGEMATEVGETTALPPSTVNLVGNVWMRGASSATARHEVRIKPMPSSAGIFFDGNIGPNRPQQANQAPSATLPQWSVADIGEQFARSTRFLHAPIAEQRADVAYAQVLDRAGARVPARDAADSRVVESVRQGTGRIIDSQNAVGGWPSHRNEARPADWDTDGDGIPDAWEIAHGLNPNDPADANRDRNGDGYTNIEEYLNSLVR